MPHRAFCDFQLALHPIETGKFPTGGPASMTGSVQWSLKALHDVPATAISSRGHDFCSHPAAAARASDEENLGALFGTVGCECCVQALGEVGGDPAVGKCLPLQDSTSRSTLERSGMPTNADSARVRTSTRTAFGSPSRRFQVSRTGTSSMPEASVFSTIPLTQHTVLIKTRAEHLQVYLENT